MNLFAVHHNPRLAARALCDRHVVRMTLETAQILCTVAWQLGYQPPYRPTHLRHPCVIWTASHWANWRWVVEHGLGLADEFERRYGKRHRSRDVIEWVLAHSAGPPRTDRRRRSPFVQAMPQCYRGTNSIEAYRRYYHAEKAKFATWRPPSHAPFWWKEEE